MVHWKRNVFQILFGKGGKEFVKELSRLFRAYAEASALEPIALKAITVLSILVLQKPFSKPKAKQLTACLERRMAIWTKGDITTLLEDLLHTLCLRVRPALPWICYPAKVPVRFFMSETR